MIKNIAITITVLLVSSIIAPIYGQTKIDDDAFANSKTFPQEKIFVHQNTSFLLTGEFLYYKIYCLNTKSNNLSHISKIAYVELVGTDKKPVFKHKIKLESGLGQGDFFITTSIPSGNYKLIAYTQWMKNRKKNTFFQSDILIVNPFQENQDKILETTKAEDSNQTISNTLNNKKIVSNNINDFIELNVNAKEFLSRKKVTLKLNSLKGYMSFGNYSISVRKIDTIKTPKIFTAKTYTSLFLQESNQQTLTSNNKAVYLPELRGELLSGKVLFKGTNKVAPNIKVALSIPGKQFVFKVANSNASGIFYFNLDKNYNNTDAIFQVLGENRENYEIRINEQGKPNYAGLITNNFKISSTIKDLIIKRSVYDQIENAYLSEKQDSIKAYKYQSPFYNTNIDLEYLLDDYTRFPTIRETFVEIIDQAWVSHNKDGYEFHVLSYDPNIESIFPPLVLVDGFLVQNITSLLDYDAGKVKKITLVRDKYIYNSQIFQGIISIETFNGEYKNLSLGSYIENVKLDKPSVEKIYYNQMYDNKPHLNRIPDFRSQLLWRPNFALNKKQAIIEFFTSDNIGDYEINLEGFTKLGYPVSIKKIFSVVK
jgi:hypothetical protein